MTFSFSKYHGAGNDFILVDNRGGAFDDISVDMVNQLCARRFGIGADGFIRIEDSTKADFKMVYHNADGKIGSMCGNGSRCAVLFARQIGVEFNLFSFEASDGLHRFELTGESSVKVSMRDVKEMERSSDWLFMNTGSPHVVVPVHGLPDIDVLADGRKNRNGRKFKEEGVNVNFVEPLDGVIHIRTYERGVEDETLACGTGCVAAALWAAVDNDVRPGKHSVKLKAQGGILNVAFERKPNAGFVNVFLEGPVQFVFDGTATV